MKKKKEPEIVLNTGDDAFLHLINNSFVKLKVIRIEDDVRQDGKPVKHVVAKVTGGLVWPYRPGDIVTTEGRGRIVPRKAVKRTRNNKPPVILPFTVGE